MIKLEDIEKRLAVKKADGMTNPDGTQPKENQQNVPDAKTSRTRSPWVDAGIGAAGGGLLGSALGYLYGHKGKWLAYDAIAGGIAGGGLGYMVGNSNNKAIQQEENKIDKTPKAVTAAKEKMNNKVEAIKKELYERAARGEETKAVEVANTPEGKISLRPIYDLFDASKGDPEGAFQKFRRKRAEWYTRAGLPKNMVDFLVGNRRSLGQVINGQDINYEKILSKEDEANLAAAGLMKNPEPLSRRRFIPKHLDK